jgi:hypothetical protein
MVSGWQNKKGLFYGKTEEQWLAEVGERKGGHRG